MNSFRNFCLPGWFDSLITSDHSGTLLAQAFKPNATAGTLTGTTAGTITYYQPILGNFLVTVMKANNYKNASGTRQHITLPVTYTTGAFAIIGGILQTSGSTKCYFYTGGTGGTLINCAQWGLGAAGAAGGFPSVATNAPTVNLYDVEGAFDTFELDGSNTGNANGWVFLFGL